MRGCENLQRRDVTMRTLILAAAIFSLSTTGVAAQATIQASATIRPVVSTPLPQDVRVELVKGALHAELVSAPERSTVLFGSAVTRESSVARSVAGSVAHSVALRPAAVATVIPTPVVESPRISAVHAGPLVDEPDASSDDVLICWTVASNS
jgi:hypothetical protein